MRDFTRRIFSSFFGLFLVLFVSLEICAQVQYFEDFESTTLISGSTGYDASIYELNGFEWEIGPQALIGNAGNDIKNGSNGARLRLNSGVYGQISLQEDLPNIGELTFLYSRANFSGDRTGVAPVFQVEYSTDAGMSWTAVGSQFDLTGVDVLTSGTVNIDLNQPIRIRFIQIGGDSGKRWNIDDITFTQFGCNTESTYYADTDGDGFGDLNNTIQACTQPEGYVTNDGDCDDTDENINPNTVWYLDNDGDGFGDNSNTVQTCQEPFGATYVLVGNDCDDNDDTVYPGAPELCDGKDNDCNGSIDDGLEFTTYYVDADNDGFGAGDAMEFCEDPGAGYVTNNDDCDDTDEEITVALVYYLDADGDGYGDDDSSIESCDVPAGNYVLVGGDCDDNDETVYPGATEVCNGKDNDCNFQVDDGLEFVTYYVDADVDGFGAGDGVELCEDPGVGYSTQNGDCDDEDPTVYPGAEEIPNDGIDQNCDGEDLVTIGLNENVQLSFSIVPNPTTGDIVIKLSESYASNNLEVYALTGELVASTRFNGAVVTMDLSELNTGMYLIKIANDRGTVVQRVVKK